MILNCNGLKIAIHEKLCSGNAAVTVDYSDSGFSAVLEYGGNLEPGKNHSSCSN